MLPINPETYLSEIECLHTREDIDRALQTMAQALDQKLEGKNPLFLCVMVGAMIPAGHLLSYLKTPVQVEYIDARRYRGNTVGATLEWRTTPRVSLKDRTIVLFDDVLDHGVTLKAIIDYCYEQGAKEVITAVLIDKHCVKPELGLKSADFTALHTGDDYIFGFGLDYKEYLRNLPGIYRFKQTEQSKETCSA